jgi:hypothetical protein
MHKWLKADRFLTSGKMSGHSMKAAVMSVEFQAIVLGSMCPVVWLFSIKQPTKLRLLRVGSVARIQAMQPVPLSGRPVLLLELGPVPPKPDPTAT